MTITEFNQTAKQIGLPAARRGDRRGEYFIRKGSMVVVLGFEGEGLVTIQEKRAYGLTGLKLLPRENLCTHEVTGFSTLTIKAPVALAGATIWLDGSKQLGLPPAEPSGGVVWRSIGSVPSGTHELRIEKGGFQPVIRQFRTSVDQETAEVVIGTHEIQRGA